MNDTGLVSSLRMATMLEVQPNIHMRREIRRESRVTAALPVTVEFADASAPQTVCTYDGSQNGARIARPRGEVLVDQTFWLIRKMRKALHRVVWIGSESYRNGQIGVECVQDGKRIWDDELQKTLQEIDGPPVDAMEAPLAEMSSVKAYSRPKRGRRRS